MTDWQSRGLCAQTDPEAFFPDSPLDLAPQAKEVCGRCEVWAECLAYALATDKRHGVWGGMTERERRRFKRRAAVSPAVAA